MALIAERLAAVAQRIELACQRASRPREDVTLVAVSKRHPAAAIEEAYAAGQRVFGENYARELAEKAASLAERVDLEWHFIGQLQRNKAKLITPVAHLTVETVDSPRLARELDKRADGPIAVLAQVNVGREAQKGGCAPEDLDALLEEIASCAHLSARGLMTIPPAVEAPEDSRRHFAQLRELASARGLRELSMGMSADLEVAVEEGATIVRVGTAIFGPRPTTP